MERYLVFNKTLQNEHGLFRKESVVEFNMSNDKEAKIFRHCLDNYEGKKCQVFNPKTRKVERTTWVVEVDVNGAKKKIKENKEAEEARKTPKKKVTN